jgi:hypothetical protein
MMSLFLEYSKRQGVWRHKEGLQGEDGEPRKDTI